MVIKMLKNLPMSWQFCPLIRIPCIMKGRQLWITQSSSLNLVELIFVLLYHLCLPWIVWELLISMRYTVCRFYNMHQTQLQLNWSIFIDKNLLSLMNICYSPKAVWHLSPCGGTEYQWLYNSTRTPKSKHYRIIDNFWGHLIKFWVDINQCFKDTK